MPVNLIEPLIQANRQRSQDMVELGTMIKNIRNYNRVKKLGTAVAKSYFSGELDPNNPQSFGTNLGKIAEETGSSQAEVFHVVSTFGKTLQEMQAPSRNIELALEMLKNSGVVNEATAKNIEKQLGVVLPKASQGQNQPVENNTGLELQTTEQPTDEIGSLVETLKRSVGEEQDSTPEQNLFGLPQQADMPSNMIELWQTDPKSAEALERMQSQFDKPSNIVELWQTDPKSAEALERMQSQFTDKGNPLKGIKSSLETALSNYNNIMSNVGVYVPDENRLKLAEQRRQQIVTLAKSYVDRGGNIKDLGVENLETFKNLFIGKDQTTDSEPESSSLMEKVWDKMFESEPKEKNNNIQKLLDGKPSGIYKVNGKEVKWNGTKIIK